MPHKLIIAWRQKEPKIFDAFISVWNLVARFIAAYFVFFHRRYTPNKKVIGIDITAECNLACPNCEASCRSAPVSDCMSLKQIGLFVNESVELNHEWEMIKLRGGEPTLHPQFWEVLHILEAYKENFPNCVIIIQTNGASLKSREMIRKLPDWVRVSNSARVIGQKKWHFENFYWNSFDVAPLDVPMIRRHADFTKGCWRTRDCNGLGLNRHGYYPCSPGATVDRVQGLGVAIPSLREAMASDMKKSFYALCRYCGHLKEPNERLRKQKISKTWLKAYSNYRVSPPKLRLYGDNAVGRLVPRQHSLDSQNLTSKPPLKRMALR
jgi:hypothetical protein